MLKLVNGLDHFFISGIITLTGNLIFSFCAVCIIGFCLVDYSGNSFMIRWIKTGVEVLGDILFVIWFIIYTLWFDDEKKG